MASEFDTEVDITLNVSDRNLRSLRSEVESALSGIDIDIGVGDIDTPHSRGGRSGGPKSGGRGTDAAMLEIQRRNLKWQRQSAEEDVDSNETLEEIRDAAIESANALADGESGSNTRRGRRRFRWERQRTGDLESAVELLDDIKDNTGGGASGVFGELIGMGGGILGGGAAGAIGAGVSTAIGSAVGSAVGDVLSDQTLSVNDPSPLSVEDTGPLAVEETGPLSVEETDPLSVDDPSPLSVEDVGPLPVEETTIPVEQPTLEVETPTLGVDRRPLPIDRRPVPVDSPADGGGGTSVQIGVRGRQANMGGKRPHPIGQGVNDLVRSIPAIGDPIVDASNRATDWLHESVGMDPPDRSRSGSPTGSERTPSVEVQTVQHDTTVEIGSIDLDVQADRIIRETTNAFEREMRQVERELQQDIDSLEREVDNALR